MHVLVAGPVDVDELASWLPDASPPDARGGPSVTRLVVGLLEAGHTVTVAATSEAVPDPGEPAVFEGEKLRLVLGHRRSQGRARDAFAVERAFFRSVATGTDADVVHAHWTYEEALGCLAARPDTVVTARDWGPTVLRHHRHPYRVVRLGMQLRVLRRAALVTAPSPYMATLAQRVHRAPVAVVPNPIAARDIRLTPRTAPNGIPTLVAVNNGWGPRKNVGSLLMAFATVRATLPEARLELYGDGYEVDGQAHRWASERGAVGGVVFRGRVPLGHVIEAMERATVFVHPAREESFGNVLVEAMARATPVVAGARSGAVPWVVGDSGALVDVESPDRIAAAVIELCRSSSQWERLSASGHANVIDRFRTDAVVAAYETIYQRVMRR